jgi:SAM-dependent methyltransferase
MNTLADTQNKQFEKFSRDFEKRKGRFDAALNRELRAHLFQGLEGKRILDVGNGGQAPEALLGEDLAAKVKLFVGLDRSLPMLLTSGTNFTRINADGFRLPFRDGAFDHVLVNGVFHHLGYASESKQAERLRAFVLELKRVSRCELLAYEIFLPSVLERAERLFADYVRPMPTFVFSEGRFDRILAQAGLRRRNVHTCTSGALTSPFYWYLVMLDYPWLKVPAILSPFRHSFFKIEG